MLDWILNTTLESTKKSDDKIWRQKPTNYLSVFDYFVGLELKGLKDFMTSFNAFIK